jgi:hypothetical protein
MPLKSSVPRIQQKSGFFCWVRGILIKSIQFICIFRFGKRSEVPGEVAEFYEDDEPAMEKRKSAYMRFGKRKSAFMR